ncbi:MAG: DsbC family protein [Wenzhouxiangellaceae bacterium]
MNRFFLTFLAGALLASGGAFAQDYDEVRARLQTLTNVEDSQISIAETPVAGVLQVRLGSEIVYMSDDARYLLQGRMFDLDTRQDLTDQAMSEVRKGLMSQLSADDTITFGPDDSDFELYVFTDVDCGYCRKLHEQIREYNDAGIQIHYAAFPRAGVGSDTFKKMTSVWCADDPHEAMNVAKRGERPNEASCESPVQKQYTLGQAMGVTGTPALLTPGGDLIPGYVPPMDLKARLAQIERRSESDSTAAAD